LIEQDAPAQDNEDTTTRADNRHIRESGHTHY